MLKLTSRCIHLGLTVLALAGVSACSTSAMKGSSHNASDSNAASLSSGSGGSADGTAVTPASGTTGDAGAIFTSTSFSPLSPQDMATPGCSIPQTVDALKKLAAQTASAGSGWGSGSGSGSGWGAGTVAGSGWGAGMAGGSGWGVGKGSGASDCPAGNDAGTGASSEPLPTGAKLWGGAANSKTTLCSDTTFTVSLCQWAQSAKANEKPVHIITLTTKSGAKFAQPFGTAVDAATKTACDAAAAVIGKLLGGTATCGTYPAT